jgi:hypothetical protein
MNSRHLLGWPGLLDLCWDEHSGKPSDAELEEWLVSVRVDCRRRELALESHQGQDEELL